MNKKKKLGLIGIVLVILIAVGCGIAFLGGENKSQEKKLASIQMLIDQYYLDDTENVEFDEGVYKGVVEQLQDPYSVYYTKKEYDELMEDDSGHYKGIGVVVSQNINTKEVMITRVFEKGPAAKAGLKRYDIITEVDGKAVANMEVGQIADVHLKPSEAYGEADPDAIFTVDIDKMPGAEALEAGQQVYLQNMYGQPFPVKVTAKDESTITFDANHEMAGKELNFQIEIVEIL